jgi:hypothetical protein
MNIDERYTLEENYVTYLVDCMDMDTLIQFAYENIKENLYVISDSELIEHIEEYAPHLLDS